MVREHSQTPLSLRSHSPKYKTILSLICKLVEFKLAMQGAKLQN